VRAQKAAIASASRSATVGGRPKARAAAVAGRRRPPRAASTRELGRHDVAAGVKVPRHKAGPPETLSEMEYENVLRVPDRRSARGKRDYALLRVLGDCGLRSAELRGLVARDLRRPRANARHLRLFVRGKGGTEREVPIPEATQTALEAWLSVHRWPRGRGLRDEHPVFVCLGRFPGAQPPEPFAGQSTSSCAPARWPPACPNGSRTRAPCAPTGPLPCSKAACPSTASLTASATPTCGPPTATPSTIPTPSTTSPMSWTAATKRHGERGAESQHPAPRRARRGLVPAASEEGCRPG